MIHRITWRWSPVVALLASVGLGLTSWAQPAAPAPTAASDHPRDITFDFRDAELKTLIGFLAKLDNRVVVMDDKVKAKVSVTAPGKVTLSEAYQILMAILDVNGFTLTRTEQFLKVMAKRDAIYNPVEVFYGVEPSVIPEEDRVVTAIIPIRNAKAATVLESLRPLISPTGNSLANNEAGLLIITDVATNTRRLLQIMPYLDTPAKADLDSARLETRVHTIKYLTAKDIADALSKVFAKGSGENKETATTILPVEAANSLLVTADAITHERLAKAIADLDVRLRQVFIDARIVEFQTNNKSEFGVTLKELGFSANGSKITNTLSGGVTPTDQFLAYSFKRAGNVTLDAQLTMFAQNGRVKILSSPRLVTADNKKAKISAGQEEPIVKSVTNLADSQNNTVSDFVYKDVGIEMELTPHINVDRDVNLEIAFKISDILEQIKIGSGTSATLAPRIGKREVTANVTVMDGETLVIGGLVKDTKNDQRKKVPWLGDIPLLGYLFSNTAKADTRAELLLFITPHVIENTAESKIITESQAPALEKEIDRAEPGRRP